jgi:hypothetical protein
MPQSDPLPAAVEEMPPPRRLNAPPTAHPSMKCIQLMGSRKMRQAD